MGILKFNKPETNIHRAFGLFALLQRLQYTKGKLNYKQKYIIVDTTNKEFYSSTNGDGAIDLPADYMNLKQLV